MIGLLLGGTALVTYAVQPLPLKLVGPWFGAGLIELMIAGALLGVIYRPRIQPSAASQGALA